MIEKSKLKPKIKESKPDFFIRITIRRIEKAIKNLRLLRNCSNRNKYEYTNKQINNMIIKLKDIQDNLDSFHIKNFETFKFRSKYINEK